MGGDPGGAVRDPDGAFSGPGGGFNGNGSNGKPPLLLRLKQH